MVEFCCGEDSVLGKEEYSTPGCNRVRLTEKVDLTTRAGIEFAKAAVSVENCLLWASLPCWQHYNKQFANARNLMKGHKKLFAKLLSAFEEVAEVAMKHGAIIVFEWPTGCAWWNKSVVQRFMKKYKMLFVDIHGCSLELKDKDGVPIKKPWTCLLYTSDAADE